MNYLQRKKQTFTSQIQQGILPFGYKKVEYLESTGTQYIDTGIKNVDSTKFTFEINTYSTVTNNMVCGARSNTNTRLMWAVTLNLNMQMGYGSTFRNVSLPNYFYDWCTLKSSIVDGKYKQEVIFYDTSYDTTFELENFDTSQPIYLFGCNNRGSFFTAYPYKGRISVAKMFNNGIEIGNFIPCLDNNNRPCMYDTVSKQTYYNEGNGEFLYGEVIN